MVEHLEISSPWQENAPKRLVLKELDLFTPRKVEILQLILNGYGEPEICIMLEITPGTLKNHMYGTDTSQGGMQEGDKTAMGIFGIVEYLNHTKGVEERLCRPSNMPTVIATLIGYGVVAVE